MTYRKDIDFLRALAMIGIFFYHLSVPGLSGGYVFLELFFVISGYLISSIIIQKIQGGGFSIKSFYVNRFFRLFPTLITAVILTLIAGFFILTPAHFKNLSGASFMATVSLSNFYFWTQVDYFDIGKYLKPLLHTWSLGVEEQFYFIWPALLVFIFGFTNTVKSYYLSLAALFALSLGISIYWSHSETMSAGAYYLLPSRMFEFVMGAAIAQLGPLSAAVKRLSQAASDMIFILGLSLIALAVMTFEEHYAFPGYIAILPCFGAMLCIIGGAKSRLAAALSNRPTVFIGQISYSLYLAHWPVIVYYKYGNPAPLGAGDMVIIFALSFALATLLHIFIEQPFRQKSGPIAALKALKLSRLKAGYSAAAMAALTIGVSAFIYQSHGMSYRLNTDMEGAFNTAQNDHDARQPLIRAPACHYNDTSETYDNFIQRFEGCNPRAALMHGQPNIAIIGDSHGADVYAAISQARPDVNLIQFTKAGCYIVYNVNDSDSSCATYLRYARKFMSDNAEHIDGVIYKISGRLMYEMEGTDFKGLANYQLVNAKAFLEQIAQSGVTTIWLGPNVEFETDYRQILETSKSVREAQARAAKDRQWPELDALDADLNARFKDSPVHYISSRDICGGPCPLLTPDGFAVTPDIGHWGANGSAYMAEFLLRANPIEDILQH